jgi:DNA-binding beta-propeller fold protein YncE
MKVLATIASCLMLTGAASINAQAKNAPVLQLTETIPLPGVTGGFDHFEHDSRRNQLYLAAEDHGTVEVIGLNKGRRVGSITGFKNPHSILFRPGASTLLITDSGPESSALVDAATRKKVRTVKLAPGANCVLFDPERKVVYVTAGGDRIGEKTSTLQAVNPATGRVVKSVQVDALHLQPMALDAKTGRLFVNLADQNAIAIYDRSTLTRIATWRIPMGSRNSPIVFDSRRRRLFVVASEPGILLEFDADSGKLLSSISTPPNPDDMALDPITQRVFVPGNGTLSVYDVSVPGQIKFLQRVETGKEARTGILFASGSKFAVAVPAGSGEVARVLLFDVLR